MTKIVGIDLDIESEKDSIMVLVFAVGQDADEIVISTKNKIDEAMTLAKKAFTSGHLVRVVYNKNLAPKETIWMPLEPLLTH
ncbi:hypothetical protein HB762_26695 (plasmid) [Vibrio campbellii]|uniref:DUF2283 domain-containing protein n=1 Tax=Vibrio campbellii TaxID=680 RepID=A0ABY5IKQ6_9VIBR|nr:hypothetical protein [Vibrio campbellii]UTZ34852.1 hypothetical protein HB762_26695 [Vibrio campbellii]